MNHQQKQQFFGVEEFLRKHKNSPGIFVGSQSRYIYDSKDPEQLEESFREARASLSKLQPKVFEQ